MISLMSIIIVFFAMSPYGPHTSVSQTPTKNADYSWTTGAPLPTARSEIAGAALDGKIYMSVDSISAAAAVIQWRFTI
jgi:hypothetical protein